MIFYFKSNTSFLTTLNFNILDIDLIVCYASFEMLHTEVRFLWYNNLLFNPKIIILWVSLTIVQFKSILTKRVQNYFEVMIHDIIPETSHARRKNVTSFVRNLVNQLFHGWHYYHHEFILEWLCAWVHSWTQTLCIKQGVSDLHLSQFSSWYDVSPQFSSVKLADNICEWDSKSLLGLFMLYIWQGWLGNCWIMLPLQKTYLVHIVWLLL